MTILIKGVQILSGGEKLTDKSDIFISGDKISAVGNFSTKIADRVIDGQGCFVSPGFIDINTDSDHYLSIFSNPQQGDFLRQGVTTIIGGQCGASLAPLLYGHLDSIRKWADISQFNVNWHEVEEFLSIIEKRPLGVNFGTLVGHSTIRRDLVGEETRNLTPKEFDVFRHVISQALRQGAFGLSTGLSYAHSINTPADEVKILAQLVQEKNGVYTTHLRESDTAAALNRSIEETLDLHQKTGVKTIINHFLPIQGTEKAYRTNLKRLKELPKKNDIYFNISPFVTSILPIYTFLPSWAKKGSLETMYVNLEDPRMAQKIQKDIPPIDPDRLIISRAESNEVLIGRSLRDCMELYGTSDSQEALCKIMQTTHLKASVFYENVNGELLFEALSHPRCLISSNAASLSKEHTVTLKPERARRTFPKFLILVEEKGILPIEEAVQKITELPARLLNIQQRGLIREGYYADIVGFRGGNILFTIVNGQIAFENHELHDKRAGKVLRHSA